MQSDFSIPNVVETIQVKNGVIALAGYGLDARIDRGRLCLKDGIANRRREASFTKATCGIKRLVLLGHSGAISLEALRWLHDIDAGIAQIDADGNVILASAPPKLDNVHLRRAQALAYGSETGLQIIRGLLTLKIAGQAQVAKQISGEHVAGDITSAMSALENEADMAAIRVIEGHAANIYWNLWTNLPLNFIRQDAGSIPDHWKTFVQRSSPLTNSQRNAANPANAMLNYLYGILEAETRIAILTIGLDPGMGFLHQDLNSRDSLVYDIMEAARPEADKWLVDFINRSHFRRKDFFERRDGTVRVSSQITQVLALSAPHWAKAIAPQVEWVAKQLHQKRNHKELRPLATHLTENNRSMGRDRLSHAKPEQSKTSRIAYKRCKECGKPITGYGKFCSDDCYEDYRKTKLQPEFEKAGIGKLRKMRERGKDPAHGGEAAKKRGQTNASRAQERQEWEAVHGDGVKERKSFVRDILPRLRDVPLSKIVRATGFSKRYASLVRRGEYIPHPMHYDKLVTLVKEKFTRNL